MLFLLMNGENSLMFRDAIFLVQASGNDEEGTEQRSGDERPNPVLLK